MKSAGGNHRRWIAALPMYDIAELRASTDAWWRGLAQHFAAAGIEGVPEALTRPARIAEVWDARNLLFGQGCGYPLTHAYRARWQVVATPVYAAEGCAEGDYRSRILVRDDHPARTLAALVGAVAAVNEPDSHSGHIALRAAMREHTAPDAPAFARALLTGGHAESMAAVLRGEADVCAVDCVTYALLARCAPAQVAGLRTLAWSRPAPGLPWIAGPDVDADTLARLRTGLQAALADTGLAGAREALLIAGSRQLPDGSYERIPALARAGAPAAFL